MHKTIIKRIRKSAHTQNSQIHMDVLDSYKQYSVLCFTQCENYWVPVSMFFLSVIGLSQERLNISIWKFGKPIILGIRSDVFCKIKRQQVSKNAGDDTFNWAANTMKGKKNAVVKKFWLTIVIRIIWAVLTGDCLEQSNRFPKISYWPCVIESNYF